MPTFSSVSIHTYREYTIWVQFYSCIRETWLYMHTNINMDPENVHFYSNSSLIWQQFFSYFMIYLKIAILLWEFQEKIKIIFHDLFENLYMAPENVNFYSNSSPGINRENKNPITWFIWKIHGPWKCSLYQSNSSLGIPRETKNPITWFIWKYMDPEHFTAILLWVFQEKIKILLHDLFVYFLLYT